jgi:hypothetical protein
MHRRALLMVAMALVAGMAGRQAGFAADPAKPTGTIKGTVKFSDGSVAANVKVEIFAAKGSRGAGELVVLASGQAAPKNPAPVAKTTTDGSGKYTLEKVAVGKYRLNAGDQIKGFSFAQVSVEANKTTTQDLTIKKRRRPGL